CARQVDVFLSALFDCSQLSQVTAEPDDPPPGRVGREDEQPVAPATPATDGVDEIENRDRAAQPRRIDAVARVVPDVRVEVCVAAREPERILAQEAVERRAVVTGAKVEEPCPVCL